MKITIGIVDDHKLFVKSVSFMLESFESYHVLVEAYNGKDLQKKMADLKEIPDIILVDVNMPVLNGVQTAQWLQETYPAVKIVALSMKEDDRTIISMLKAGCCAYLLKDTDPDELEKALGEIHRKGYYNADASNINYRRLIMRQKEDEQIQLSAKETQFLRHACSDMTYKHIASLMNASERSVDNLREILFGKFNVQSRVGLCLEAIRKGFVEL